MIKVIAFDLDDTLWDVAPIIQRAEATLGVWLNESVPQLTFTIADMRELRHDVLEGAPDLAGKVTELRRRIIEEAMRRSGLVPTEARRLSQDAIEVFLAARNEIELFEGARDAMNELAGRYMLGALSNGNADIARVGLSEVFSFHFSAEQVGAPKPAEDLFRAALEHTGTAPHEMVYVGDNPEHDIDPANNLGLRTVWVKSDARPRELAETEPDVTIPHVRHVVDAVRNLDGQGA